jgi:hypothetical protein
MTDMNDIDPSWRVYARLQSQSRRHACLDALGWGLEAGLNEFLNNIASSTDPDVMAAQAENAVARGKARERHRLRLRLRYLDPCEINDPTARLDDRARLRETFERASDGDQRILLGMGFGHNSATLAGQLSNRPAAMRKRMDRLRTKLAA